MIRNIPTNCVAVSSYPKRYKQSRSDCVAVSSTVGGSSRTNRETILEQNVVKWHVKKQIKKMMMNRIRPTIQTNKNKENTEYELYKSNYKSINWNQPNEHGENLYKDILLCERDYPDRFINLIGYSLDSRTNKEYLADFYLIKNPITELTFMYYTNYTFNGEFKYF